MRRSGESTRLGLGLASLVGCPSAASPDGHALLARPPVDHVTDNRQLVPRRATGVRSLAGKAGQETRNREG